MDINPKYISITQDLIKENHKVLSIENQSIKQYLEEQKKYNTEDISLIHDIIVAIKSIDLIRDKTSVSDIIDFMLNSDLDYRVKLYTAYFLVSEGYTNPFDIFYYIESKEIYFRISDYFTDTFSICSEANPEIVFECIRKNHEFTRNDLSNINGKINSYFERHYELNELLVSKFYESPEESLHIFVQFAINNIIKIECSKVIELLNLLLNSDNPFIVSAACKCCCNLVETNWEICCDKIDELLSLCNKWDDLSLRSSAIQFFVKVLATKHELKAEIKFKLQDCIRLYVKDNDHIKFAVISILRFKNLKFDNFKYDICKDIFDTKVEDNLGLINQFDLLTYQLLKEKEESEVYSLLKIFYIKNKGSFGQKTFTDYFHMTFNEIPREHIQIFSGYIFKDMLSKNKIEVYFSMEFINEIAYKHTEIYCKIDLIHTINRLDVLNIIKIISAFCYKADFVCYFGIELIKIKIEPKELALYKDVYIQNISQNYTSTSKRIAEEYPNPNAEQKILINHILSYATEQEEIFQNSIKIIDLEPSTKRIMQYRISESKHTQKILEESQKKSILQQMISKQFIKYGKRMANMVEENGGKRLSENEFAKFEYFEERPKKYCIDPLGLYSYKQLVLNGDSDKNEIGD